MFKKDFFVGDKELQDVREKISCPQLDDVHYGAWGCMSVEQRIMMYRMIETIKHLRRKQNKEKRDLDMYTVKELIEALQKCPQDNVVFCTNVKTGFSCGVISVGNDLVNGTVDIFFEEQPIIM